MSYALWRAAVTDEACHEPGVGLPRAAAMGCGRLRAAGASTSLAEALAEAGGAKPPVYSIEVDDHVR
jgi:hypothetical protein